jgi:hypothetical protein
VRSRKAVAVAAAEPAVAERAAVQPGGVAVVHPAAAAQVEAAAAQQEQAPVRAARQPAQALADQAARQDPGQELAEAEPEAARGHQESEPLIPA